jgi:hypothetical protein
LAKTRINTADIGMCIIESHASESYFVCNTVNAILDALTHTISLMMMNDVVVAVVVVVVRVAT